MYVLYRVGGGAESNVAANTITNIDFINATFSCDIFGETNKISEVRDSISVNNPYPSVTGKDAPSIEEIRAMIKYNSSAQKGVLCWKIMKVE